MDPFLLWGSFERGSLLVKSVRSSRRFPFDHPREHERYPKVAHGRKVERENGESFFPLKKVHTFLTFLKISKSGHKMHVNQLSFVRIIHTVTTYEASYQRTYGHQDRGVTRVCILWRYSSATVSTRQRLSSYTIPLLYGSTSTTVFYMSSGLPKTHM